MWNIEGDIEAICADIMSKAEAQPIKGLECPSKMSFDGHGLNDCDSEYKERVATLTATYRCKHIGKEIEKRYNMHGDLLAELKAAHKLLELAYEKRKNKPMVIENCRAMIAKAQRHE